MICLLLNTRVFFPKEQSNHIFLDMKNTFIKRLLFIKKPELLSVKVFAYYTEINISFISPLDFLPISFLYDFLNFYLLLFFWLANKSETLSLAWILLIASANKGATESLVILSTLFSPGLGRIVSVTKTCSSGELLILSKAFPENNPIELIGEYYLLLYFLP